MITAADSTPVLTIHTDPFTVEVAPGHTMDEGAKLFVQWLRDHSQNMMCDSSQ